MARLTQDRIHRALGQIGEGWALDRQALIYWNELVPEFRVPGMVTRWGYQGSRYHRPHDAYLVSGKWCEVRNVPTELGPDGKPSAWAHVWAACQSRTLRDRHADQSAEQGIPAVTITVSDGVAVAVVTPEGDDLAATLAPWDLEGVLGID